MSALDDAVAQELADGARLKSQSGIDAIVIYGAGNVLMHITFAALSVAVSGYFVFPWIVWANTIRQRRVTLDVNPDGTITRRR